MIQEGDAVYIAGPMQSVGPPDYNHFTFHSVATDLRALWPNLTVYNPADNFGGLKDVDEAACMTLSLRQMTESNVIVFLPGWEASKGATMEARAALAMGMRCYQATFGAPWSYIELSADEVTAGIAAYESSVRRNGSLRTFATGATRDTDDGKYDYEGFLSPAVLEAYAAYMHKHRVQPDGSLRASDNWQKGVPLTSYMQSMWRHFMDVWFWHRGRPRDAGRLEAVMALLFNVQGYAFELLRDDNTEESE